MKKLLSLPPNLVGAFHRVAQKDATTYFCTSDPAGRKLGSGGGTTWLLEDCYRKEAGTNPPVIEAICQRIDDLCTGYKLPGAGGGGFMYMVAKDVEAARRIRETLTLNPITPNSRFIDMSISTTGLKVSRS